MVVSAEGARKLNAKSGQWRQPFVSGKTVGLAGACVAGVLAAVWVTTVSVAQGAGQWTPLSPSPFLVSGALVPTPETYNTYNSGRVSSIAVDPRDALRWLVGVGNGGVWETRDAGASWTPITDDAPTLAIGAVAFAPGDPDIVYVATGESVGSSIVAHVGVGLLKSANGGQSWALLGQSSFARASVRRLRVDPNDANILLAASQRGLFGRDSGGGHGVPSPPLFGVLRSTNGGASWTRTLAGQATGLEVDPTNFSRQYAAIADQSPGRNDTPGASSNGIYRSTNGGVSWSRIEGPWGTEPSPTQSAVGRIELAVAPSNPNVVYASIQIPPNGGSTGNGLLGLFRTDDAWADTPNWIQIPTQATGPGGYCGQSSGALATGKCGYSHVISVDPRDANTLFAGGERNLWRCTRCGASPTWTNTTEMRNRVFVHVDFHALAWVGDRLIIGNDGGVYSTTDLGATWQSHNRTLTTNMFYFGALHPTDPGFALGGARDFYPAVYRASEGWRVLPAASTNEWGEGEVAISSSHPDTDWMGTHTYAVIQRTIDGGRTILQVDSGIDRTGAAFMAPVRKCPADDDVFLAGTYRIWRTNNFFHSPSPSWEAISPDRPFSILAITFVDADRSCNTFAYGTGGGEVRLTRDGGATWTDLDPSKALPERSINSLAFDPTNANRLLVAVSSYDEATPTKPGHIFRTDNALAASPTWTRVGPPDVPFANMPFNVVAIDPRDTRTVYAGSDNGLWQSSDGGGGWTKIGLESGLPPASVFDIQINPRTNRTVIFTYGRGAYTLTPER